MILRSFSSDHSPVETDQIFLDFIRFSETIAKNNTREMLDYPIFELNLLETQ